MIKIDQSTPWTANVTYYSYPLLGASCINFEGISAVSFTKNYAQIRLWNIGYLSYLRTWLTVEASFEFFYGGHSNPMYFLKDNSENILAKNSMRAWCITNHNRFNLTTREFHQRPWWIWYSRALPDPCYLWSS